LLCTLLVISAAARATDLRGKVESPAAGPTGVQPSATPQASAAPARKVPLAGAAVALFVLGENTPVHTTSTDADGFYYFTGIKPGSYVLQIHGANYPLTVQDTKQQDVAIITVQER
jgi:hypothetical protein